MSAKVSGEALDMLLRKARSYNDFKAEPVSDEQLRALYDIMKWGPTTANSQPQRILFLRSARKATKQVANNCMLSRQFCGNFLLSDLFNFFFSHQSIRYYDITYNDTIS